MVNRCLLTPGYLSRTPRWQSSTAVASPYHGSSSSREISPKKSPDPSSLRVNACHLLGRELDRHPA